MVVPLDPPLKPRSGVTLTVLAVCRISTENQDARSLADQEDRLRRHVAAHYDGPTHWVVIATRGSGEQLDRDELAQIEAHLEGGRFDALVAEDLGRICRRTRAYDLCELAEDRGTRVLALNDAVDTGRDGWQMGAFFSVVRHEMYNKDTAARIRRSLRNRFLQGGVIQAVPYGVVKPAGAKLDTELSKDPAAGPVYDRLFAMLEGGASYSEAADWLNRSGVPTNRSAGSRRWTGYLVRAAVFNPILKGVRVRNEKVSKRVNKTGKHRSVKAPAGERLERAVPHLAFIDPARYDRVVALLKARNARYRRRGCDGRDDRKGAPRKRTVWPGQHLTCDVCGRLYYYGGHGRKAFLMCSGSRGYACWNGATVDGMRACVRLADAVRGAVGALPDFDAAFLGKLREEAEAARAARAGRSADLDRRPAKNVRETDNLMAALREAGPRPALVGELATLEGDRDALLREQRGLEALPEAAATIPSRERVQAEAEAAFAGLARGSAEFGRLMHRLVPRLEVRPYRLLDGGRVVLRAFLTLDLAPLVPGARDLGGACAVLRHELVVYLFDPPQRAAFRARVVALRAEGLGGAEVAAALGITRTAVQSAAALDRMMRARGLTDPYAAVAEPPADQKRMRRHKYARYRFNPMPGIVPATVSEAPGLAAP